VESPWARGAFDEQARERDQRQRGCMSKMSGEVGGEREAPLIERLLAS
jgi:hypothetical protein